MHKNSVGYLCLGLAATIWGGTFVVSKVVLGVVPTFELVWIRYVIAFICLVAVGILQRVSWRLRTRDIPLLLAVSLIGYVVSISAQFIGTKLSTAQLGAVITSSAPAFMVLFAFLILKEQLTWRKVISLVLASAGVLLIVGFGDISQSVQLGGLVLALAAATWAFMSVLVKKIPTDIPALVATTYVIFAAAIFMTPFAIQQNRTFHWSSLSPFPVWAGVIYLGAVSTALAFLLWNKGLQLTEVSKGSLFFFFQPLVGTLLGWILLGEKVNMGFWIGAVFIFCGVLLVAPLKTKFRMTEENGV